MERKSRSTYSNSRKLLIQISKPHKYKDDPFSYPPPLDQGGYRAPPPMMGGALPPEPPQYAQFEVGKNGLAVDPTPLNEDALPPMPSWDNAARKHIPTEAEKDAVELGELNPATGQHIPLMAGGVGSGTSGPPSPAHDLTRSPYNAQGQGSSYSDIPINDQYGQKNAYNQNGRGYGGQGMGGRGYGPTSPQGMDGMGRGYGLQSPQDPYGNGINEPNGVYVGAYARQQPLRQNTDDSNRAYPPQPQRQYSNDSSYPLNQGRGYAEQSYQSDDYQQYGAPRGPPSRGPGRMASPPVNNNSGFDFNTPHQYSRPSPLPPPGIRFAGRPLLGPPFEGGW